VTIAELGILVTCGINTIGVIGGLFVSMRNSRKIEQVHLATNGMKTELVNEVRAASFAKGVKSEKDKGDP
jgi:hypothetical protein